MSAEALRISDDHDLLPEVATGELVDVLTADFTDPRIKNTGRRLGVVINPEVPESMGETSIDEDGADDVVIASPTTATTHKVLSSIGDPTATVNGSGHTIARLPQGQTKTSTRPTRASTPKAPRSTGKLDLADMANVNAAGELTRPDGTLLTDYEKDLIAEHELQIRKGLGLIALENGLLKLDSRGRAVAHRENGQFMSNRELAARLTALGQAPVARRRRIRTPNNGHGGQPVGTYYGQPHNHARSLNTPPRGGGGGGTPPRGPGGLEVFSPHDDAIATLRKNIMHDLPIDMARELANRLEDFSRLAAKRSTTVGLGAIKFVTLTPRPVIRPNGETATHADGSYVMELPRERATDANVDHYRQLYEEYREVVRRWEENQLQLNHISNVMSEEAARNMMLAQEAEEARVLAANIATCTADVGDPHRQRYLRTEQQSGWYRTKTRFVDWWARQGGGAHWYSPRRLWGSIKKATVMGVLGAPVGVAAGIVGMTVAGPLVGIGLGAWGARRIARGLMRGRIEKAVRARTAGYSKMDARYHAQMAAIDGVYDHLPAGVIAPQAAGAAPALEVSDAYGAGVGHDVVRNRVRVGVSAVMTGAGGFASTFLGEYLAEAVPKWVHGVGGWFHHDHNPAGSGGKSSGTGNGGQAGNGANQGGNNGNPNNNSGNNPNANPNSAVNAKLDELKDQLAKDEQEIADLNKQLGINSQEIADNGRAIAANGQSISELQSQLAENSRKIDQLKEQLAKLHEAKPTKPEFHGKTGQDFYVEQGSGIIREIHEYATSHHYNLAPGQVDQVYAQLHKEFGRDIINRLGTSNDTYLRLLSNGAKDVRISSPGEARWFPHVEARLRELLARAAEENKVAA